MKTHIRCLILSSTILLTGCVSETEKLVSLDDTQETSSKVQPVKPIETTGELHSPVRLEADGKPIDIGLLSGIAHAGPCVADVDCDGDEDLLVGDFPGYFWFFENDNSNDDPKYLAGVKLQAGGEAAKTPVY